MPPSIRLVLRRRKSLGPSVAQGDQAGTLVSAPQELSTLSGSTAASILDDKRVAADGRWEEGRRRGGRVGRPTLELCQPHYRDPTPDLKPHERDFSNLVNELIRLLLDEELFTFVLEPQVEPTNNHMERQLRSSAQDRKAGRTSQTAAGAHRRSVIVSVLESLRANLDTFSLASVLAEVGHWMNQGISLFARQWQAMMADKSAAIPNTS